MAKSTHPSKHLFYAGGVAPYYLLIIAVVILVGISAVMVVSASSNEAIIKTVTAQSADAQSGQTDSIAAEKVGDVGFSPYINGLNNILYITVGALIAFVMSRLDYRKMAPLLWVGAVSVLVLLIATKFFGTEVLGARRWINVGISIQASEFAKPILIAFAALVFEQAHRKGVRAVKEMQSYLWTAAGIVVLSLLLILTQPDFGTTVIIVAGLIAAYAAAGHPMRSLLAIVPIGVVLGVWRIMSSGNYQSVRITEYLSGKPSHQVLQALYAFGTGGLLGVGPGLSRQKYHNLPEAQNDFILAIIGEELGLIGALLVVSAFGLMLYAGMRITLAAKDQMGRAIAGGATIMLVGQAMLNMGGVLGLVPVTGKPLPFVTLGGSAMLSAFMLLGLLLSVARFGGQAVGAETVQTPSTARPKKPQNTESKAQTKSPRKQRAPRVARESIPANPAEGDDDEDSLEWRWDSGAHIPGNRTGR